MLSYLHRMSKFASSKLFKSSPFFKRFLLMKLSKIGKRIYDKFDDTERRKIGIFRCKFHTPFLSRVD